MAITISGSGIVEANLADGAVTSAKLATNSVDSAELIAGAVDNSHLASGVDAGKLTTGTLPAGRYTDTDTVYTHPTTAGNKHIPSGGATDQVLTYSSSGTASWVTPASSGADTSLSNLTSSADKLIIKAWVKFRVNTGTPSISDSINVSSITDHDTGKYTINFNTAFSSANYSVSGVATEGETASSLIACGDGGLTPTSSAWRARCSDMGNSKKDPSYMFLMFVGNQ